MKNKIAWLLPSVIVLMVALAGVLVYVTRSAPSSEGTKEEWKTYTSKDGILTFSYPGDWRIDDESKQNIGPMFRDMYETSVIGKSSSGTPLSVNLVVEQAPILAPPAEVSVERGKQWVQAFEESSGVQYKIDTFEPIELAGVKAGVTTGRALYPQMGVTLLNKQLIFPFLSKTYYLTITSDEQSWTEAQSIFDKIVQSVRINR